VVEGFSSIRPSRLGAMFGGKQKEKRKVASASSSKREKKRLPKSNRAPSHPSQTKPPPPVSEPNRKTKKKDEKKEREDPAGAWVLTPKWANRYHGRICEEHIRSFFQRPDKQGLRARITYGKRRVPALVCASSRVLEGKVSEREGHVVVATWEVEIYPQFEFGDGVGEQLEAFLQSNMQVPVRVLERDVPFLDGACGRDLPWLCSQWVRFPAGRLRTLPDAAEGEDVCTSVWGEGGHGRDEERKKKKGKEDQELSNTNRELFLWLEHQTSTSLVDTLPSCLPPPHQEKEQESSGDTLEDRGLAKQERRSLPVPILSLPEQVAPELFVVQVLSLSKQLQHHLAASRWRPSWEEWQLRYTPSLLPVCATGGRPQERRVTALLWVPTGHARRLDTHCALFRSWRQQVEKEGGKGLLAVPPPSLEQYLEDLRPHICIFHRTSCRAPDLSRGFSSHHRRGVAGWKTLVKEGGVSFLPSPLSTEFPHTLALDLVQVHPDHEPPLSMVRETPEALSAFVGLAQEVDAQRWGEYSHSVAQITRCPWSMCVQKGTSAIVNSMLMRSFLSAPGLPFLLPSRLLPGGDGGPVREKETYEGGLVIPPTLPFYFTRDAGQGYLLDVVSMYPSVMRELQVTLSTTDPAETCLLLQTMGELQNLKQRCEDPERKRAVKKILNSFYGTLAYPLSRFYCLEVARRVTQRGREVLQGLVALANKRDLHVFYGDTDSVMVLARRQQPIGELVADFEKKHKRKIALKLECTCDAALFLSKKRYAQLSDGPRDQVIQKGILTRNYCPFVRDMGMRLLRAILQSRDLEEAMFNVSSVTQECARLVRQRAFSVEDLAMTCALPSSSSSLVGGGEASGPVFGVVSSLFEEEKHSTGPVSRNAREGAHPAQNKGVTQHVLRAWVAQANVASMEQKEWRSRYFASSVSCRASAGTTTGPLEGKKDLEPVFWVVPLSCAQWEWCSTAWLTERQLFPLFHQVLRPWNISDVPSSDLVKGWFLKGFYQTKG